MRNASHFSRFHGRSTFKCDICGRVTRDVDQGGTTLCQECYDIAGMDNHYNDSGTVPNFNPQHGDDYATDILRALRKIAQKGGDVNQVVEANGYAFPHGIPTQFSVQFSVQGPGPGEPRKARKAPAPAWPAPAKPAPAAKAATPAPGKARKSIKTPRGKLMSVPQYLSLTMARSAATQGGGPACEHGHFDCAAWEGGPCADELLSLTEPTSH